MASISAANAVLVLTIPGVFATPQQLQGFGPDDVFDIPSIKSVQTLMGVDGILSGGFVYVEIMQHITLQADSASNLVFDAWWTQMQAAKDTNFIASGLIKLPSIASKYNLSTGFLSGYKPAPAAKKLLQARQYELTWGGFAPAPG